LASESLIPISLSPQNKRPFPIDDAFHGALKILLEYDDLALGQHRRIQRTAHYARQAAPDQESCSVMHLEPNERMHAAPDPPLSSSYCTPASRLTMFPLPFAQPAITKVTRPIDPCCGSDSTDKQVHKGKQATTKLKARNEPREINRWKHTRPY